MLNKVGKKTREWQAAKRELIKGLKNDERFEIVGQIVNGNCPDCGHWHGLTPDHLIKRSLGGGHTADNIEWVCNEPPCYCHSKRDNMGDPNKKKPKSKKPDWQVEHKCKNCKALVSSLLCTSCGKLSV